MQMLPGLLQNLRKIKHILEPLETNALIFAAEDSTTITVQHEST